MRIRAAAAANHGLYVELHSWPMMVETSSCGKAAGTAESFQPLTEGKAAPLSHTESVQSEDRTHPVSTWASARDSLLRSATLAHQLVWRCHCRCLRQLREAAHSSISPAVACRTTETPTQQPLTLAGAAPQACLQVPPHTRDLDGKAQPTSSQSCHQHGHQRSCRPINRLLPLVEQLAQRCKDQLEQAHPGGVQACQAR